MTSETLTLNGLSVVPMSPSAADRSALFALTAGAFPGTSFRFPSTRIVTSPVPLLLLMLSTVRSDGDVRETSPSAFISTVPSTLTESPWSSFPTSPLDLISRFPPAITVAVSSSAFFLASSYAAFASLSSSSAFLNFSFS